MYYVGILFLDSPLRANKISGIYKTSKQALDYSCLGCYSGAAKYSYDGKSFWVILG